MQSLSVMLCDVSQPWLTVLMEYPHHPTTPVIPGSVLCSVTEQRPRFAVNLEQPLRPPPSLHTAEVNQSVLTRGAGQTSAVTSRGGDNKKLLSFKCYVIMVAMGRNP